MTIHVPFQVDEARPADKARVLGIARRLGAPDEVLLMLGLIEGSSVESEPARRKLVAAQVLEIRRLHSAGLPTVRIAERFDVSVNTVTDIVRGRTWKNLR
jgi:hypothetical protein